jgi:hypothetical protein
LKFPFRKLTANHGRRIISSDYAAGKQGNDSAPAIDAAPRFTLRYGGAAPASSISELPSARVAVRWSRVISRP